MYTLFLKTITEVCLMSTLLQFLHVNPLIDKLYNSKRNPSKKEKHVILYVQLLLHHSIAAKGMQTSST